MLSEIKRKELVRVFVLALVIIFININPLLVNTAVYAVASNLEQYRVEYITQTYIEDSSEHFIYKYTFNDKDAVELVKKETEKSYKELSKTFNFDITNKVTVIIFPDIYTMNKTLKLKENQKSIGLYYCGFVSILSPKAWIHQKDKSSLEKTFVKTGPIAHELTHYFVDKKTNGNYPIWFTEGVALYFEKQITGFEWGTDIKDKVTPYTIDQLTKNFEQLNSDHSYRRSYEIINNYVQKNSVDKLLNIMEKLGEGYKLEDMGL